jgi:hypothetical protein
LALLLAACARRQAPSSAAPAGGERTIDDSAERASLVNLARGSTVVSRTGEAILDLSALRAVDGDPGSFWQTPPHDVPQSVTIALPARSRIDKVGIRTERRIFTARRVGFEVSLDGTVFVPLATVITKDTGEPQWFAVTPAAASFLRVTMFNAAAPDHDPRLHSILTAGAELEPARIGRLEGDWSVNGVPATFLQRGGHVAGVMALGKVPIGFDGGSDGRIYRLAWVRGNDYGVAAFAVSPDSQHLSAIEWHEEAIPLFYGDSWFGERPHPALRSAQGTPLLAGEGPGVRALQVPDVNAVAVAYLRRTGRFPLYGLRFNDDGTLNAADSDDALAAAARLISAAPVPLRAVAHQFRERDDAANLARARRELESLRKALESRGVNLSHLELVAAGSANPRQKPATDVARAMYSSIDLEIRR